MFDSVGYEIPPPILDTFNVGPDAAPRISSKLPEKPKLSPSAQTLYEDLINNRRRNSDLSRTWRISATGERLTWNDYYRQKARLLTLVVKPEKEGKGVDPNRLSEKGKRRFRLLKRKTGEISQKQLDRAKGVIPEAEKEGPGTPPMPLDAFLTAEEPPQPAGVLVNEAPPPPLDYQTETSTAAQPPPPLTVELPPSPLETEASPLEPSTPLPSEPPPPEEAIPLAEKPPLEETPLKVEILEVEEIPPQREKVWQKLGQACSTLVDLGKKLKQLAGEKKEVLELQAKVVLRQTLEDIDKRAALEWFASTLSGGMIGLGASMAFAKAGLTPTEVNLIKGGAGVLLGTSGFGLRQLAESEWIARMATDREREHPRIARLARKLTSKVVREDVSRVLMGVGGGLLAETALEAFLRSFTTPQPPSQEIAQASQTATPTTAPTETPTATPTKIPTTAPSPTPHPTEIPTQVPPSTPPPTEVAVQVSPPTPSTAVELPKPPSVSYSAPTLPIGTEVLAQAPVIPTTPAVEGITPQLIKHTVRVGETVSQILKNMGVDPYGPKLTQFIIENAELLSSKGSEVAKAVETVKAHPDWVAQGGGRQVYDTIMQAAKLIHPGDVLKIP